MGLLLFYFIQHRANTNTNGKNDPYIVKSGCTLVASVL